MTKKITLIICYCLIGVIAAALIICALVPKNYLPQTNDPDTLQVTYIEDTNKTATYQKGSSSFNEEDYNRIMTSFRNSFKQSVLSALFAGELITTTTVSGIGQNTISKPDSGFQITFYYDDYQNIYENGSVYNDPNYSIRPVQTKIMYCYITNDIGFSGIYLYYEDDSQGGDVEYYRLQTIASTSELHSLCMEILNITEETSA